MAGRMKPIPTPDNHFPGAAQGWLEPGNWQEGNAELENLTPELRAHPAVLLSLRHLRQGEEVGLRPDGC